MKTNVEINADDLRAERTWLLQHGQQELIDGGMSIMEAGNAIRDHVEELSRKIDKLESPQPPKKKGGRPTKGAKLAAYYASHPALVAQNSKEALLLEAAPELLDALKRAERALNKLGMMDEIMAGTVGKIFDAKTSSNRHRQSGGPRMSTTLKLRRSIETWKACYPKAMAHEMSDQAKAFAFDDMRHDILALNVEIVRLKKLLCVAAYPRRGTEEEGMTILQFAQLIQKEISHEEAVNL